MSARSLTTLFLSALLLASPASADPKKRFNGRGRDGGANIGGRQDGSGGGSDSWGGYSRAPSKYDYQLLPACGSGPGLPDATDDCEQAHITCAQDPNSDANFGEQNLWRRLKTFKGKPDAGWTNVHTGCGSKDEIGVPSTPPITLIEEAFHRTPFAKPALHIQPEGDLTLVNLPTYFEVEFAKEGFEVGEVDPVPPEEMLGFVVDIRPTLVSVTYKLGDDQSVGPTRDLGGPYPSGNVQAVYSTAGDRTVTVTVVYGGEFRVNNGEWQAIEGTAPITSAAKTLQVREARARLVK